MKYFNKKVLSLVIAVSTISTSVIGLNTVAFAADTSITPVVDPSASVGTVTKTMVTFDGDTKTTKGFTWYTSKASINSDLQIVEKTSDTANFAKGKSFTGTTAVPSNNTSATPPANTTTSKPEYVHKATATGLKANTTYYYRVGDASIGLWGATSTFQTAQESGAFTFLDLADPQAKDYDEALLAASTFKKALNTVPNSKFLALNGDIVDDGSIEYEWDWLFNNIGQGFLNTTIAPIAGNHDNKSGAFVDHFNLSAAPGSDTTTGVYYSYDYSNAHFVMLNNNENTKVNDLSKAQLDWMKADIQKARANGSQWIIVDMHKGPYTTSNHATDSDINDPVNGSRKTVAPLMAQLGVDLVLQGHDHIYARSKPIKADGTAASEDLITENNKGQKTQYQVNPDGTIYLIPATAGPKVYYKNTKIDPSYYSLFDRAEENHAAIYGQDPADSTRPKRSQIQNFESISIDKDKLSVISYEIDQNKNNAQPYIIDTFGIEKPTIAKITEDQTDTLPGNNKSANYTVSMNNITKANTFETTVKYDSNQYSLNNIDYLQPGLKQISKDDKNGTLKLVFTKENGGTITTSKDYTDLVKLHFTSKGSKSKGKDSAVRLLKAEFRGLNTKAVSARINDPLANLHANSFSKTLSNLSAPGHLK
ncbi:purple acid phosphatase family protein [Clostridium arbusti]|uniref:purple acid phosphatase family protein n=1 Tax=Clostridium arbusti TaxID=1137848 RepID=UPI00028919A5|nr:metallophosphoesterase family protein [Clostridium arbusti]